MTKYAGTRAVVIVTADDISLAIAKRLVEGGARVVLTAGTAAKRANAGTEVGSAARVVAPADVVTALEGEDVDFVFADTVAEAKPLLPRLRDGGAVVLTTPTAEVQDLATEMTGRGIRVNAVTPLGERDCAEEVARVALFLATEAAFTTGAHIPVDGDLSHR